jgi:hypothetical protein
MTWDDTTRRVLQRLHAVKHQPIRRFNRARVPASLGFNSARNTSCVRNVPTLMNVISLTIRAQCGSCAPGSDASVWQPAFAGVRCAVALHAR